MMEKVIDRSRVLLIPSAYDAEWSIRTNESLAKVFMAPYDGLDYATWDRYYLSQYRIHEAAGSWLASHSSDVDAVFYVNLYKDFSYPLLQRYQSLRFFGLVHGVSGDYLEPGYGRIPLGFEKAISAAATICCTSEHLLGKLRDCEIDVPTARVTGLPLERVRFSTRPRDRTLCIYNHRLVEEKGVADFARVWRSVTERIPEARCVLTWPRASDAGRACLDSIAGLPGVILAGLLPRAAYHDLLTNASVGISLARYENFGTSYCYALLHGVCYFVPDRLAYKETSLAQSRYSTLEDLSNKLCLAITDECWRQQLVSLGQSYLLRKYNVNSFLRRCGIA